MTKNIHDELQQTARQALVSMHPSRQGDEPGGLPFRRLLSAAFRARYLIFGTTLFGILVGTFLAITTANSFVSTGKFLFTASGAESTLMDPTRATETSQETIGTAATYILSTNDLLSRVVKRVTPERILAPYQPGNTEASAAKAFFYKIQRDWNATKTEEMTPDEALKRLQKTLTIERPRYTDILIANCTANDPFLAQEILEVYLDEAVKWHIEKYEDLAAFEGAENTAKEALIVRDRARAAMRSFLDKHEITDFKVEKERLQEDEINAASRVVKLKDDLDIKRRLYDDLTKELEGENAIKRYVKEKQKLDLTSGALTALGAELAKKETDRARLVAELRDPNNTRIQDLDQQIAAIKEAMKSLSREAMNAEAVEVEVENPAYLSAIERRSEARLDITGLEGSHQYAVGIDAEAKRKLKAILKLEPEHEQLSLDLGLAEKALAAAQVTWEAAQQKRALGQGHFSSLKEVEKASLPLEKTAPNRGKLIIAAMFVGLFLGLGLVLLLALPDTVVRTRDDLEGIEGLAVIGVMPRLENRNIKRHAFRRKQGL